MIFQTLVEISWVYTVVHWKRRLLKLSIMVVSVWVRVIGRVSHHLSIVVEVLRWEGSVEMSTEMRGLVVRDITSGMSRWIRIVHWDWIFIGILERWTLLREALRLWLVITLLSLVRVETWGFAVIPVVSFIHPMLQWWFNLVSVKVLILVWFEDSLLWEELFQIESWTIVLRFIFVQIVTGHTWVQRLFRLRLHFGTFFLKIEDFALNLIMRGIPIRETRSSLHSCQEGIFSFARAYFQARSLRFSFFSLWGRVFFAIFLRSSRWFWMRGVFSLSNG